MTMDTYVSSCVHYSNPHIFVNSLSTYRVSTCLTNCHTSKVVPRRRYDYVVHVLKYARLSTFSSIYVAAKLLEIIPA
jgi:hypothetical protein